MDDEHFAALKKAKSDNGKLIYRMSDKNEQLSKIVKPMMEMMYEKLLQDLKTGKKDSPIFKHHIDFVNRAHYARAVPYIENEPNQIVSDYIASMTDDYFIDLYKYLFPDSDLKIEYFGYFK